MIEYIATNNCEECGVKYSQFVIDPPTKKELRDGAPNFESIRKSAFRRQKEFIASKHRGHTYSVEIKEVEG